MKNNFYLAVNLIIVITSFFFISTAIAQQRYPVKGRVVDNTQQPIKGALLTLKGTTQMSATDESGNFTLQATAKESVLVVSCVGYIAQEITINEQSEILVKLEKDEKNLDEVVVVAYGNQNKSTVTSAISSIETKDLLKSPVVSPTNMLAGVLPGVSAVQTSGQPGKDAATIYIRGAGSLNNSLSRPLVLVDGIEREFSQIDPNEIKNISVLKDAASTAVYGVRGANGVILVTTRRGSEGRAQISLSTSTDLQQPISYVEQTGSYEFARFWNIKKELDGIDDQKQYFTPEQIEAYRTGSDPIMYPSMNWKEYLFKDYFIQNRNNFNISGGSKDVKYFISTSYLFQNGLLKDMPGQLYDNNYRYNRYNYRANIDANLTKSTTMKLGVGGLIGKLQEPRSVVSGSGQDQNPWVIAQVWSHPFAGPGFIDGVRTKVPQDLVPLGEILRDGMFIFYGQGYNQEYTTTLNLDLDITQNLSVLTDGLSISAKAGYDNRFNLYKTRTGGAIESQTVYYKSYFDTNGLMPQTDPDYDKSYIYVPSGNDTPLNYAETNGRGQDWYLEGRLNYQKKFGDHDVSGLLLYNQSRNYYPTTYTYIPRSYIGWVGRATYGYQSKYLFDVNLGYTGSENFAPGKTRFGIFPAFSTGWIASNEKFMENQTFFDFLKFRLSWGRVGNDKGVNSRFMYMPAVWTDAGNYSFGTSNPNGLAGSQISQIGNDAVTWETAVKQNYGVDAKVLNNRLNLTLDYFRENREGILISPASTPLIVAMTLPNLNIGKVDNSGYEISLGWNDRVGEVNYYINANTTFARNKIIYNDEVRKEYDYMNETGGSTGRQTNIYKYIRLYQYNDFIEDENGNSILKPEFAQPYQTVRPGDAMYADLNNDMIVDGNDRFVYGYSERPEYTFGFNYGLNWKGFNMSMQWLGATNVNKLYDIEFRIPFTNAGKRGLLTYFYEGSWTPENQLEATYPRPSEDSESWNSEASTLWLQDASYIRLKSLNMGYTFNNAKTLNRLGIKKMGITLSGYNLFTLSALKFIDPEGVTDRFGNYPLVKLYSLGLNLNF